MTMDLDKAISHVADVQAGCMTLGEEYTALGIALEYMGDVMDDADKKRPEEQGDIRSDLLALLDYVDSGSSFVASLNAALHAVKESKNPLGVKQGDIVTYTDGNGHIHLATFIAYNGYDTEFPWVLMAYDNTIMAHNQAEHPLPTLPALTREDYNNLVELYDELKKNEIVGFADHYHNLGQALELE